MYAIVDIETTGGYAANNAITEVAIVLHDGNRELKRYETLVRPGMLIPRYVQALTGITDEMVADAPDFEIIAPVVSEWLRDAVFVAHNVNFDYSFLRHQLQACGFELNSKKLCTVRLSRKVFPEAQRYSLGNICRYLGIDISNRHRAGGDADATTLLFEKILQSGGLEIIRGMLKGRNSEQYLPIHLPAGQLEILPQVPGVYYFHDQKGKVIYVGKAKNLRHRVASHFSNNKTGRQKQEFLRNIYSISHETTGTELMAFLLECIEIKRLWPAYNRSMKRFEATYGLYVYEDLNGYSRLILERRKRQLRPVYTFSMLAEGRNILRKLIREFRLCPKLCFIQRDNDGCEGMREETCDGACEHRESPETYNGKVRAAIATLLESLPSFTVMDRGRHGEEKSCILVEQGRVYGMGYLPADATIYDASELKQYLTPCTENDYMRGLIYSYVERWPAKKIMIQL
ncbi:MAG TPA: exonuclease domain-containing protein [Puia sp.]|nr:exonuclease domain-containing protein [Puia sp.]